MGVKAPVMINDSLNSPFHFFGPNPLLAGLVQGWRRMGGGR